MRGLYVHIPFCAKKCGYCDFYSVAGKLDLLDRYVDALLLEAQKYAGLEVGTVYIGGGTPSLLGARRLEKLFGGLSGCLDLRRVTELSIEANPESARADFMESALSLGINRISIGVQSLNDEELRKAGRIHTAGQAVAAVGTAVRLGFENVSVDIIIGLPGQAWRSLENTLDQVVVKGVTHLSAYCLSIEEHTPFAANPPGGLTDDDGQAELFERTADYLARSGFVHYEISNFSLPGKECAHNLNYWRGGEYVGLGPSAASHIDGRRTKSSNDLMAYLRDPLEIEKEEETLDPDLKIGEEAMLRLRLLREGLDLQSLAIRHDGNHIQRIRERLDRMSEDQKLVRIGTVYRLPSAGVLTSNQVLMDVIS
jgi:oxygen-independent coproporphyrinogen III oxidase